MKWSQFFIPTLKETPIGTEAVSHQLLLRAGLVHMLTSGVYSYLPLGLRALRKMEEIIRQEMQTAGASELLMPCLHPIELWKQTGRDQVLDEVMIKFEDKRGRPMCLGPTHEEVITDLVKNYVQSYKQLPVMLYQIQTKFRDELRTRFGIVRACEFVMKDAYSFDTDEAGLKENYARMYEAYKRIFARMDLDVVIVAADSGAMGGDVSHEFMVPAPIGEDVVLFCSDCHFQSGKTQEAAPKTCPTCGSRAIKEVPAIEIGHIFQLGTKYSQAQQAQVLNAEGKLMPIIMGCYGIGVSRVLATIIETHNDEKGIIWPKGVAPFALEVLPLETTETSEVMSLAKSYYDTLSAAHDVLLDDRPESAGRKFNDADLIGLPLRVIIGKRNLANGQVELKIRKTNETFLVHKNDVVEKCNELLKV